MNTKLTKHQSHVYDAFTCLKPEELKEGVRPFQVINKMNELGYSLPSNYYSTQYERSMARTLVALADKKYISKKRYRYTDMQYHSFWKFFLLQD